MTKYIELKNITKQREYEINDMIEYYFTYCYNRNTNTYVAICEDYNNKICYKDIFYDDGMLGRMKINNLVESENLNPYCFIKINKHNEFVIMPAMKYC